MAGKEKKDNQTVALSFRVTNDVYERAKRACFRDEMTISEFLRWCFTDGTERLLAKQNKKGFKLQKFI